MREEIMNHKRKMINIVDDDSLTDEEKRFILLEMFKQLKIMESKQTEIIPNDFTNYFSRKMKRYFVNSTKSDFSFPNLVQIVQIQRKLQNKQPLLLQEVEIFLHWLCFATQINLFHAELNDYLGMLFQEKLDTYNYENRCGLGSQLLLYNLQKVGLEAKEIDIIELIPSPSHEMVIVKIPIEIEGKLEYRNYLLDCTYRQFFTIFDCNDSCPECSTGYYMMFEQEKIAFANQVLQNGFFELTQQTAKTYFDGFYLSSQGRYCFDFEHHQVKKKIVYSGEDYLHLIDSCSRLTALDIESLEQHHVFLDYFDIHSITNIIQLHNEYTKSKNKQKNNCIF